MADSVSVLADLLLSTGQENKEQTANDLFNGASPAMLGMIDPSVSGAFAIGFIGGRYRGVVVAPVSGLTLAASATNYAVLEAATGDITVASSSTHWGTDTAPASGYLHLYKITTDADGIVALTGVEDHRAGWF